MHACYLRIASARMSACVCLLPRLLITSDRMWREIDPNDWSNKFYSFYMKTVVSIISGHGVSIHMHRAN